MMALLGDVGGTNTRLALCRGGGVPQRSESFRNADHSGLEAVLRAYLAATGAKPARLVLALACPVDGDELRLTNLGWAFSLRELGRGLGIAQVQAVNDFAALALSLPRLGAGDSVAVGGGEARPGAPIALLGPGTGLGVAGLVPCGEDWMALPGEGGHVSLAAGDAEQAALIERLRGIFGHVSAERVLSGPGLANLYRCVSGIEDSAAVPAPEIITRRALIDSDPAALRTLDHFLALLGTVAGNLALTLGARGGVYLGGGILPGMVEAVQGSRFRERFEDKGRFRSYLQSVPTRIIVHPQPALLGLAALAAKPGP